MGSQIQNPFDSGAGYFGNALNQFNKIDLGGDIANLGRTINAGRLSDLMAQNGGLADQAMSPLAMLATPQAQKAFQSDLALQRTDRDLDQQDTQLDISQQNADTSYASALWGHQYRQNTNKLGWANYGLKKNKYTFDKKNQFMLDMARYGQLKNTYDKGLQDALAADNYMPSANVSKYKQNNQWMLDASRNYMQNYSDPSKYIAQAESKGDYNAVNPESTAFGKYQQLDGIRKVAVERKWVKNDAEARTPAGQEKIQRKLNEEYAAGLKKLKVPVTNETMLAVHQWGYPTFEKAVKGQLAPEDINRIAHTKAYKMLYGNQQQKASPVAKLLDADTIANNRVRYRDANTNAEEMLFKNNINPIKLAQLQEQANANGITSDTNLNPIDAIRAMGIKERGVLNLVANGASDEEIRDYVKNFDPKHYTLNDEATAADTTPIDLPEGSVGINVRRNFMGQLVTGQYGRPLADISINGTPTNEILSKYIPGFQGSRNFSKAAHDLTNKWNAVTAHKDTKRQALITEQVKADQTTPVRISEEGFTPVDLKAFKDDQMFRAKITKQLTYDAIGTIVKNTNKTKTLGKLTTAINALPKEDPYRGKLEKLRTQIQLANSGNQQKIFESLKAEVPEDEQSFFPQFDEDTMPGILSDFTDTLSKGVDKGGAGIDFPGIWDNYKNLTDPDVFAAVSSAYSAVTGQPFTWKGLTDMLRNKNMANQGGFNDVDIKSDTKLALLVNKTKEAYEKRTSSKIDIASIRKDRNRLKNLQKRIKNDQWYVSTPHDKELLRSANMTAKELKDFKWEQGKPKKHLAEDQQQVREIQKALGYDVGKETDVSIALDALINAVKNPRKAIGKYIKAKGSNTEPSDIDKLIKAF